MFFNLVALYMIIIKKKRERERERKKLYILIIILFYIYKLQYLNYDDGLEIIIEKEIIYGFFAVASYENIHLCAPNNIIIFLLK